MEPRTYQGKAPIRRGGRPWYFYVIYFFAALFLITSGLVIYIMKTQQGGGGLPSVFGRSQIEQAGEFNLIIAGLDNTGDTRRTDSLIVAHISVPQRSATLISIPRDSLVPIPGYEHEDKINAAYALGGPELMVKTVEEFLGVPIPFYFVMYVDGFEKVIDALGGVEVNVEKNMNYDDRAQDLHIHLKKGLQVLNGEQAMGYARFRHDAMGDFARIERQQKVLDSIQKKALSIDILSSIPALLETLSKNKLLITNLSMQDALAVKRLYNENVRNNTRMFMLPAVPETIRGISYVIPDRAELAYIVSAVFQGGYHPSNKSIKIDVKNGCGYRGVAEAYARRLGYYGFDVLGTSNADSFDYEESVVVINKPTPLARAVARVLNARTVENLNPDAIADMDVVIGRDKL